MLVDSVRVVPADCSGGARLCARVKWQSGQTEEVFIEYPAAVASDVVDAGTAWLAIMLPAAFGLGEDLTIEAPVDRLLYWNVPQILSVWQKWHGKPAIKVNAPLLPVQARTAPPRMASMITGGVDSLFTMLHGGRPGSPYRIDEALTVGGLDIPLAAQEQHNHRLSRLEAFCEARQARLVPIRTNLLDGGYRRVDYAWLAHGALLAGIGMGLGQRYSHLLVSSSFGCRVQTLFPWGSHPIVDPLLCSSTMHLIHYGIGFDRVEKTRFIAEYPEAMAALHVCYIEKSATNCGRCAKCLRTLATLDVANALDRAITFPDHRYSRLALCTIPVPIKESAGFMREVAAFAQSEGRPDVAWAVYTGLARQAILNRTPRFVRSLPRSMRKRFRALTGNKTGQS